jgi:hypothetical protein
VGCVDWILLRKGDGRMRIGDGVFLAEGGDVWEFVGGICGWDCVAQDYPLSEGGDRTENLWTGPSPHVGDWGRWTG